MCRRKITDGQLDERERYGLPQDVLMWVYGLGRPWTAKRFTDLDSREGQQHPAALPLSRKKVDGRARPKAVLNLECDVDQPWSGHAQYIPVHPRTAFFDIL